MKRPQKHDNAPAHTTENSMWTPQDPFDEQMDPTEYMTFIFQET